MVGVANAKKGEKSASRFVDVYGGVRILSVVGCTITFRNDGVDKGRRFIYDAVVPLTMFVISNHPAFATKTNSPVDRTEFAMTVN